MADNLEHQWAPYSRFVPFDAIRMHLEVPRSLVREDIRYLLPSLSLAADGPVVTSLFIITKKYLCEARLNQSLQDFDISLLESVVNFRAKLGIQKIAREEPTT